MSTTARDLIESSMRLLGVLASGEAAGAAEATDGLGSLNQLIDSWSTESLLIPNKVRETFSLVAGTQTYTMGTGGAFSTSRPMEIENAGVIASGGTSEYPIEIITKDQFAEIVQKSVQSTYPQYLYADNAYPLTSLSFWAVPSASATVALYSWKPLAQLADLSTALSLPPGYIRALKFSLAVDMAPEYQKSAPAEVVGLAAESKANIKRMNTVPQYLKCESALTDTGGGRFNILTGDYSR